MFAHLCFYCGMSPEEAGKLTTYQAGQLLEGVFKIMEEESKENRNTSITKAVGGHTYGAPVVPMPFRRRRG